MARPNAAVDIGDRRREHAMTGNTTMPKCFNEAIDRWQRWLSLAIIFFVGDVDEKMDRMKRDG